MKMSCYAVKDKNRKINHVKRALLGLLGSFNHLGQIVNREVTIKWWKTAERAQAMLNKRVQEEEEACLGYHSHLGLLIHIETLYRATMNQHLNIVKVNLMQDNLYMKDNLHNRELQIFFMILHIQLMWQMVQEEQRSNSFILGKAK